jgi:hypothetical protein
MGRLCLRDASGSDPLCGFFFDLFCRSWHLENNDMVTLAHNEFAEAPGCMDDYDF